MAQSGSWQHNICDCGGCGPALSAWCCSPCLFGKAAHRLEHYPQKPDELGFSWFNGQCCFLAGAGLVGFHWLPIWLQRQDQRSKFGISGNFITDCLAACCLPCCAVAQQELDVKERAEVEPLNGKGGYGKAAEGMQYTPPQ